MFPSFILFGKTIGMYGVLAAIGFFASYFACYFFGKRKAVDSDDLILAFVCAGIGIVIGGHLMYFITNIPIIKNLSVDISSLDINGKWQILKTLFSGNVFYGGFLGGIIGILVYLKISGNSKSLYIDLYAVATPLFHCFGRIGCFFAGCCYGCECSFGFTVYGNTYNPSVNDVNRFPIQLLEAALNLIIFIFIANCFRKDKFKGELIYLYMLIYPCVRFVDEFFRGDNYRGIFIGLSTSQWISIVLFTVSAFHFVLKKKKTVKSGEIT